jgi:ryanodine receptor 2
MCNNRYDTSARLWDAVGGFLFLFANMQDKLSKHSSQLDLLKELLNLQKDMVIMMLSMLEGKVISPFFLL